MLNEEIVAFEARDSRGNPTVDAWVALEDGMMGEAIAPSDSSAGERELGSSARFAASAAFR